jgi:putative membrane protein
MAGVVAAVVLVWQASFVAAQQAKHPGHVATAGQAESAKSAAKKAVGVDPDKAFVLEAASGGMMEVELGRMASNQASSDDVKKFGQRMVDDHSKANNELSSLAQKKNITLPAEMGKKEQATRDHLSKLNGAAFDKAYMQHMVADHTKDVRAFEHESKMGKDPDIKAWAGQTLPTLQDHLKQAKQVSSSLAGAHTGAKTKKK